MKNYDVKGGNNPADPLNTSNSMGGNNSWNLLGVFDDAIGSLLFGNPNATSEIMGELTGYNSQQREFAQQDYLLEKEQAFAKEQADPVYRMERMKAAGINPNTAASGISGGAPAASPSAPSVATNTQGAAQGLSAAAGMIGTLSQNKLNEAEAENLNAQTREIHPNAEVYRALNVAQMYDDLSHIGVNEETAKSLSIANMYAPAEHAADLAVKWQSFRKMKAEYDTIVDEHNANLVRLKYLDQQIAAEVNLTNQRALEAEKNAAKAEEDARFRKQENDFAEKWGFRREQPQDSILWSMFVEDPELYNKALGELTNRSFNSELGRANASWFKMPSTPTEALERTVNNVIKGQTWWSDYLSNGLDRLDDLRKNVTAYKEFKDDYIDAKSDLYDFYKEKRRKWKEYRHTGASDQYINQLKVQMDDAYKQYSEFTEEKFANYCISKLLPK